MNGAKPFFVTCLAYLSLSTPTSDDTHLCVDAIHRRHSERRMHREMQARRQNEHLLVHGNMNYVATHSLNNSGRRSIDKNVHYKMSLCGRIYRLVTPK